MTPFGLPVTRKTVNAWKRSSNAKLPPVASTSFQRRFLNSYKGDHFTPYRYRLLVEQSDADRERRNPHSVRQMSATSSTANASPPPVRFATEHLAGRKPVGTIVSGVQYNAAGQMTQIVRSRRRG